MYSRILSDSYSFYLFLFLFHSSEYNFISDTIVSRTYIYINSCGKPHRRHIDGLHYTVYFISHKLSYSITPLSVKKIGIQNARGGGGGGGTGSYQFLFIPVVAFAAEFILLQTKWINI